MIGTFVLQGSYPLHTRRSSTALPGGHSELEPPVPIPNTEVKQLSADGSVTRSCESRTPPGS